jgi:ferredoxin-like protein FixX
MIFFFFFFFFVFFFFFPFVQARSLESLLSQLRQQKAQISAVKRELAGQMALVTGNTSSALDREVRTLSKYIFWKGSSEKVSLSAEVLRLPAPLFVLHQSIQVENEGMAECGVAEISSSDSGLSRWGLDCRIGPVKFKVAFSTVLDLAVASGNHAELQKLGPEGDTGLVSPSLTTLVRRGRGKRGEKKEF